MFLVLHQAKAETYKIVKITSCFKTIIKMTKARKY